LEGNAPTCESSTHWLDSGKTPRLRSKQYIITQVG